MRHFKAASASLLVFRPAQIDAYWRMRCGPIQVGRIDPIHSPGAVSGHVHLLAGPISKFSASSLLSMLTCCKIQTQPPTMLVFKQLHAPHVAFRRTRAHTGPLRCIVNLQMEASSTFLRMAIRQSSITWAEETLQMIPYHSLSAFESLLVTAPAVHMTTRR